MSGRFTITPSIRLGIMVLLVCWPVLMTRHTAAALARTRATSLLQVSNASLCDWRITVPVESSAALGHRVQAPLATSTLAASHPVLVVTPRSAAMGTTVVVHGTGFNLALGLVHLDASTNTQDVIFDIPTGKGIAPDAAGTFTKQVYIPYGLPVNQATLSAMQAHRTVAHATFDVTAAVGPEPPLAPLVLTQIRTLDPHGTVTNTFGQHEPVTVRTYWKTHYIDFQTGVDFGVQVSVFHEHWRKVGPLERGGFNVWTQKQFCFVLTPPKGTYSRLRVRVGLGLTPRDYTKAKLTYWRTATVNVGSR